jgi:hypothetical protein
MYRMLMTAAIAATLMTGCAVAAEAPDVEAKLPKEVNILLWGASGCTGISKMMPEMAKEIGHTVNVRVLSRSFNRYPWAIKAAEEGKRAPDGVDPDTLPDKGSRHGYVNLEKDRSIQVHVLDEIKSKKWDIIIIAVNTGMAVEPAAFPQVSVVADFSKKYTPQAKIYVFQRPSPPRDSQRNLPRAEKSFRTRGILKPDEIITDDHWAMESSRLHQEWATDRKAGLILTGDVTHWARRDKEWGFPALLNHIEAKRYYDTLVFGKDKSRYPNDRRFCSGFRLRADGYGVDHHPNSFGNYIIAATAFETIFGKSIVGNSYVPTNRRGGSVKDEIAILQRIVHDAMKDEAKYPLHKAPAATQPIEHWVTQVDKGVALFAVNDKDAKFIQLLLGAGMCGGDHPRKTSLFKNRKARFPHHVAAVDAFRAFMKKSGYGLLRRWLAGLALEGEDARYLPIIEMAYLRRGYEPSKKANTKDRLFVLELTEEETLTCAKHALEVEEEGVAAMVKGYTTGALSAQEFADVRVFHRQNWGSCVSRDAP